MKYILNFSLVFLPAERSLSMLNNKEAEIFLSAPAARLLLELIKYKGTLVHRETLLKNVWEDYGFSGSNSNLNSYLSEIRKAFILLGHNEKFIITVPKQGVKLEANIETSLRPQPQDHAEWIDVDKSNDTREVSRPNEANEVKIAQDEQRSIVRTSKKYRIKKMDIILVAVVILGFIMVAFRQQQNKVINVQQADVDLLFRFKKCNIFTIEDYDIYPKDKTIDLALKEIENKSINCNSTPYDIYFAKMLINKETYLFSFLGTCLLSEKNKHIYYCKTRNDKNGKENH